MHFLSSLTLLVIGLGQQLFASIGWIRFILYLKRSRVTVVVGSARRSILPPSTKLALLVIVILWTNRIGVDAKNERFRVYLEKETFHIIWLRTESLRFISNMYLHKLHKWANATVQYSTLLLVRNWKSVRRYAYFYLFSYFLRILNENCRTSMASHSQNL